MDLHLLRRTDSELLHLGRSNNASSFAAALGSGHAFEVQIAAMCPGLGARLPEVQRRMGGHVKNGWHSTGLHTALAAVAAAVMPAQLVAPGDTAAGVEPVQDELGKPSHATNGAMETEPPKATEASEEVMELRKHLETCPYLEADKTVDVTRALRAALGKEAATRLLRGAKQCVLKGRDGKKRKVLKEGCAKGQAWRVKG